MRPTPDPYFCVRTQGIFPGFSAGTPLIVFHEEELFGNEKKTLGCEVSEALFSTLKSRGVFEA